jgi:DNA mismatch repair ATPase MutS
MQIKKQNTLIEISELGLKIEVKADLLLNALISDSTKNVLEQMLKNKLSELRTQFEEINDIIELENKEHKSIYFNSLKEKRNSYIYEYACLTRDLYSLLGDTFERFYEENTDIMENIGSIFKYSTLYGFKSLDTVVVE